MTSDKQYALLQKNDGHTYLNTAGKEIYFRNNNSDKMTLKSNGNFSVKQDIIAEGNGYFGPAYIGKYGKTRSDYAQFSHIKMTGTNQYAITHHEGGRTIVNAASGKTLDFHNNDSNKATLYSNGNFIISAGGLQVKSKGIYAKSHIGTYGRFYTWKNDGIQRGCDSVSESGLGSSCKTVT